MANESRVFRLPAGMSTQVVANAVSSFLSSAKGMEVGTGPPIQRRMENRLGHAPGDNGADDPDG